VYILPAFEVVRQVGISPSDAFWLRVIALSISIAGNRGTFNILKEYRIIFWIWVNFIASGVQRSLISAKELSEMF
jgi:hypothetical protein